MQSCYDGARRNEFPEIFFTVSAVNPLIAVAAALAAILLSGAAAPLAADEALRTGEALRIEDAWVRAMPPGQRMSAAYMRIVAGDQAVLVRGVSSPIGTASLHETQTIDGRRRMRPLDALPLAAGAAATLAPGGRHIMLTGLTQTPREGEFVRLCLHTDRGTICTEASVRGRPASGAGRSHASHQP